MSAVNGSNLPSDLFMGFLRPWWIVILLYLVLSIVKDLALQESKQ